MVVLRAKNPDLNIYEKSFIATAISAAGTSLVVTNTQGFAANDYIVIGEKNTETREQVQITSVTNSTTLVIAAVVFAHGVDEPVFLTPWNQIVFRSGSTADGTFADLNTSAIDWDNLDDFTTFNNTAGTTSEWFRYVFQNSQTSTLATPTVPVQVSTYYCSLADVADYLNLSISQDSGNAKSHQVLKIIEFASAEVDRATGLSFKSNVVATAAYEYHDGHPLGYQQVYFTRNRPLISVQSFETTSNDETIGPVNSTYEVLADFDDMVIDKETGKISIIDPRRMPSRGPFRVRIAYTWGSTVVPKDIKRLTVLYVTRDLATTTLGRNIIEGREKNIDLSALNSEIKAIVDRYSIGIHNA